jgi:NAD(P)-dependent dehydrogenase (short-subunit alcohol dehydrogenase family)
MIDALIIGAGPAGLFAAEHLSAKGYDVVVVDRMPSPARKFLMAGRGGLNLTHSEATGTVCRPVSRGRKLYQTPHLRFSAQSPDRLVRRARSGDLCRDERPCLSQVHESVPAPACVASAFGRPRCPPADPLYVSRVLPRGLMSLISRDDEAPSPVPARAVLLALGGSELAETWV